MDDVVITYEHVLSLQVCAVKSLSGEEVARIAQQNRPAGTELGWELSDREEVENPVQCLSYEDRWHWLLDC